MAIVAMHPLGGFLEENAGRWSCGLAVADSATQDLRKRKVTPGRENQGHGGEYHPAGLL
jgi:hypothetical protein